MIDTDNNTLVAMHRALIRLMSTESVVTQLISGDPQFAISTLVSVQVYAMNQRADALQRGASDEAKHWRTIEMDATRNCELANDLIKIRDKDSRKHRESGYEADLIGADGKFAGDDEPAVMLRLRRNTALFPVTRAGSIQYTQGVRQRITLGDIPIGEADQLIAAIARTITFRATELDDRLASGGTAE